MSFENAKSDPAVAVFLTLSGGFLDAFAYVGHGHVFANTMTGNVALMGVNLAAENWTQAWRHVPPLLAFVLAVLAARLLTLAAGGQRWARQPALTCLLVEIVFLAAAGSGAFRSADTWLIPGISFVVTLQTLAFPQLRDLAYTSAMTTGNLRRAAQALFQGLLPRYDREPLREARLLGMIGLSFLLGAIGGAYCTARFFDAALWGAVALLTMALSRGLILGWR